MSAALFLGFICGTLGVAIGSALLWPRRRDEETPQPIEATTWPHPLDDEGHP